MRSIITAKVEVVKMAALTTNKLLVDNQKYISVDSETGKMTEVNPSKETIEETKQVRNETLEYLDGLIEQAKQLPGASTEFWIRDKLLTEPI